MKTRRSLMVMTLALLACTTPTWGQALTHHDAKFIQAKGAVAELSGENAWFYIEGRLPWGHSNEVGYIAISYYVYDPLSGQFDSDDVVVEVHGDQLVISPSKKPGLNSASLSIEVPGPGGDLERTLSVDLRWDVVGKPQATSTSYTWSPCVLTGTILLGGEAVEGLAPPYAAPYLYQVKEKISTPK